MDHQTPGPEPTAAPPYSRIRSAGGLVFTAGVLGQRDGALVEGDSDQMRCAFANLLELLASEGIEASGVLRLVVYLTDIAQMGDLNEAFVEAFAEPRPVRTSVVVSELPLGAVVELEATAKSR